MQHNSTQAFTGATRDSSREKIYKKLGVKTLGLKDDLEDCFVSIR